MRRTNRVKAGTILAVAILLSGVASLAAQDRQAGPSTPPAAQDTIPDKSYKSWSPMPIVMYDTDIGFGFGGKVKFVDFLKMKESFDLIVFQATKDKKWTENWYVFTFSIPDIEIRQGKRYGLSFDLKAEYDKYLHYSYYGLGSGSSKDDETIFAHGMKSLQFMFGMGISPTVRGRGGLHLEVARIFRRDPGAAVHGRPPEVRQAVRPLRDDLRPVRHVGQPDPPDPGHPRSLPERHGHRLGGRQVQPPDPRFPQLQARLRREGRLRLAGPLPVRHRATRSPISTTRRSAAGRS